MKKLREILLRLLTTRMAWPIVITIGLLCAASIMALNLSSPDRADRQKYFIAAGVVVLLLTLLPHFQSIGRLAYVIFAGTLVLLVAVFLTRDVKGAHRWFELPYDLKFQPSELAKLGFVLAMAWYLRYHKNIRNLSGLVVPFLLTLVPFALILREPDLGTALLFPLTLYAMLIAAEARLRHLLIIGLTVLLAAPGAYPLLNPYQQRRFREFARPIFGVGEQALQSARAQATIGAGGVTGLGKQGAQYIRILPEAYTDFIFAIIGVQWGFAGCMVILGLYLAFLAACIEIAASTRDHFGRLLVVGLAAMILFQSVINISMAVALIPVVGISLPFTSYGGSSLLVSMLAGGLLLNVSVRRQTRSAAALQYAAV